MEEAGEGPQVEKRSQILQREGRIEPVLSGYGIGLSSPCGHYTTNNRGR
jgi:hypothetical protein